MIVKIYERDGRFLVVIPERPQWFIVDRIGKRVLDAIINGQSSLSVAKEFRKKLRKEVLTTYQDLLKIIKPTDRVIATEQALTAKTTVAMIAVTIQCQLRCPQCYVDAQIKPPVESQPFPELTVDEHRRIALEIHSSFALRPEVTYKVNLTGGEPFRRRDILQIIEAYRDAGFEVNMSTNGLLITEEQMQWLRDNDVSLAVSLDGASASTHEAIRGRGTFAKTVKKIQQLVATGIKTGINSLIHQGNIHELEAIVDLSCQLGCSAFNPINLVQLGRAVDSKLKRVSEVEIFKQIAAHLAHHPEQASLFRSTSLFSSLGAALLAGVACLSCGVGNRPCVYIDHLGNIYPCANTQRPEFCLGNVRQQSVAECVKPDHLILGKLRELQVDTLNETCSSCDIRRFCGGDCRGETYSVTGKIDAPYVACQDRHDSIIELMWIAAENPWLFSQRAEEYTSTATRGI